MKAILFFMIFIASDIVCGFPSPLAEKQNKTVLEMVNEQTETIKKIVANQNQGHLNKPAGENFKTKHEKEQPTDDLKTKCQQYFKVNTINRREDLTTTTQRSTATLKPKLPAPSKTPANDNHLKVIKLEPVTLQKTTLINGEVVYYWHKNPNPMNLPYISVNADRIIQTNEPFYHQQPLSTTTEAPHVQAAATESPYEQQIKFVIPMPLPNEEKVVQYPPLFDQYAYYPKEVQPPTMNVPAPYVPIFHMVHAITIPNHDNN